MMFEGFEMEHDDYDSIQCKTACCCFLCGFDNGNECCGVQCEENILCLSCTCNEMCFQCREKKSRSCCANELSTTCCDTRGENCKCLFTGCKGTSLCCCTGSMALHAAWNKSHFANVLIDAFASTAVAQF